MDYVDCEPQKYKTFTPHNRKKRRNIQDLRLGKELLDLTPKVQFIKGKTDELDLIKIKNLCSVLSDLVISHQKHKISNDSFHFIGNPRNSYLFSCY